MKQNFAVRSKFSNTGFGKYSDTDRVYTQRFSVTFEYPVSFTRNIFCPGNETLIEALSVQTDNGVRVCVLVDQGVVQQIPNLEEQLRHYLQAWPQVVIASSNSFKVIQGGERAKNDPGLVGQLQRWLVEEGLDRHSYLVGIGGGAVLDLAGFVASTVHRGIRHVRVPTTVLAQNDSGIGVKNGVNAFGTKNLIGTFQPPAAVINDSAFIDVLPDREKRAGMAEAVKVALIRDADFFEWLEENACLLAGFAAEPLRMLIRRCALLHLRQIAQGGDPFERGTARPLDFGHWLAHRLEALANYNIRHGEAVAIGILIDTRYSVLAGLLSPESDQRVLRLLRTLGFPLWHDALGSIEGGYHHLLQGLEEFRQHLGGRLTITLLSGIGTGVEVNTIEPRRIVQSLDWLSMQAGQ